MTLDEALEAIQRGETTEQYKKRIAKLRRYCLERDFLQDAIEILDGDPRQKEKADRLQKVEQIIKKLS